MIIKIIYFSKKFVIIEESKSKFIGEGYMEIRMAAEQDREGIAEVYADAFFEDWKQLSHDTKKITRA